MVSKTYYGCTFIVPVHNIKPFIDIDNNFALDMCSKNEWFQVKTGMYSFRFNFNGGDNIIFLPKEEKVGLWSVIIIYKRLPF